MTRNEQPSDELTIPRSSVKRLRLSANERISGENDKNQEYGARNPCAVACPKSAFAGFGYRRRWRHPERSLWRGDATGTANQAFSDKGWQLRAVSAPMPIRLAKLIIMINNRPANVSRFSGPLPDEVAAGGDRSIGAAPIYDPAQVLALAKAENISLWSMGARRDAAKWSLDIPDLSRLVVAALQRGRFLRSEWCQSSAGGPWAACEAWVVSQSEWVETAGKYLDFTYYLKFAISRTGSILLMASNHPENT